MCRRSNSGELFFLRRETHSKENVVFFFFMNMESTSNFEAVKL